MTRTTQRAVYNPRIASSGLLARVIPWLIVFLSIGTSWAATDWNIPEAQLAGRISGVTGPGAVTLDVTNRSSLSRSDFESISRGLRSQLASRGLQFVSAEQAAATIQISLSENLQEYVWVAEIHQGTNEPSAILISVPRRGAALARRDPAKLAIHKSMVWSQENPILDLAIVDGFPTHMAVLSASQVALFRVQDGRWQPEQVLPITHARPWPRDLRGRLVLRKDHLFDAYLPGVVCRSTNAAPLALNCAASDDPWPIGIEPFPMNAFFTPSRNYFTGALAPGVGKQTAAPVFYSAAPLPREKYTLWLFAAVDGQVHLLDGVADQTAGKLNWGSGIATVQNGCSPGWTVLASSSANDALQAFDFSDREPVAASQPLEFDGPITALWAETNGIRAIAISHNVETGAYEAYRLSLTCGE